ncbi:hypothetical protein R6Z07M_018346 [Ovis aries]
MTPKDLPPHDENDSLVPHYLARSGKEPVQHSSLASRYKPQQRKEAFGPAASLVRNQDTDQPDRRQHLGLREDKKTRQCLRRVGKYQAKRCSNSCRREEQALWALLIESKFEQRGVYK